jgi:leucine dehydrogenase
MTDIFKLTNDFQFGEIHFKQCQKTGMKAIIAIHNTKLGPSLGGLRFVHYENTEQAIIDALRLAQGMSYKAAMSNLPLGGGKAVIIKPNHDFSREDYMLSFGEFVESLNGRYITALDSGTELSDMEVIATKTDHLASSSYYGDPSPHTVDGIIQGIKAACFVKFGSTQLKDFTCTVQGLGHVGYGVAKILTALGARLYVTDIDTSKAKKIAHELNQYYVAPEEIYATHCDVFVPCALGGIINEQTLPQLSCKVIAGGANNQLSNLSIAHQLHQNNVLYVPDYIINAGGLIYASGRYFHQSAHHIEEQIQDIYQRVVDISLQSIEDNIPPSMIVDTLAKQKISE